MNIRKEYTKVCLFLWILGMCFHAHPILAQSVIPVPLKMEQGTGSFLLSEKTKLYTNLQGGEAELWENYLKALPVQLIIPGSASAPTVLWQLQPSII